MWRTLTYILWCYGGICHQPDTFIKIGSGHTVTRHTFQKPRGPWLTLHKLNIWLMQFLGVFGRIPSLLLCKLFTEAMKSNLENFHWVSFPETHRFFFKSVFMAATVDTLLSATSEIWFFCKKSPTLFFWVFGLELRLGKNCPIPAKIGPNP